VWIECLAGENWHECPMDYRSRFWRLDMSLIPGNVGTTPVQNIGALAFEIKDTMVSCTTKSQ
jgi:UDP-N-acetylmuramate dehydrogenase